MRGKIKYSFVLPCRNEELSVAECIRKIKKTAQGLPYEIIVVDNASTDDSARIAKKEGARVIKEPRIGYGSAVLKGINVARGEIIIMGDSDGTYDFSEFKRLVEKLSDSDIVLGSRMRGSIKEGAMPFINRYIGNPMLRGTLNLFFRAHISDPQTGFRAFRKSTIKKLDLKTTGMEFASEMLINALTKGLKISEVPITYYPRRSSSKLRPLSDGWRHLRFLLMYSPTYLFIIPGAIIMLIGISLLILYLLFNSPISTGILGSMLAILGYQIIGTGLYARTYSIVNGFTPHDPIIDTLARHFPLERTLLIGFLTFIVSVFGGLITAKQNVKSIPLIALTFLIIGLQTIFSGFFLSIMLVEKR
ncbi:MAG: glycosyltransferase family 2 protein [Candidatus Woesearchaeota archaeon]